MGNPSTYRVYVRIESADGPNATTLKSASPARFAFATQRGITRIAVLPCPEVGETVIGQDLAANAWFWREG